MQVLKSYSELSVGRLSTTAQTLYFRLFLINNRTGWSDTFQTTNQRLMLETSINSRNTLDRAKKELIEAGFIEYIPGKDKKPSTYRLLPLTSNYSQTQVEVKNAENNSNTNDNSEVLGSKIDPKTGMKTGRKTGSQNSTCSKIDPKTGSQTGLEVGLVKW